MALGTHEMSRQHMLEVHLLWALVAAVLLTGDDDHQAMLDGPCLAWLYSSVAACFWTDPKSAMAPAQVMQLQTCLAFVGRADLRQRRLHRSLKHIPSACWAFSAEAETFLSMYPWFWGFVSRSWFYSSRQMVADALRGWCLIAVEW